MPAADLAVVGVPRGVAASEAVPEDPLDVVERRLSCSQEDSEDDSEVNRLGGPGLILQCMERGNERSLMYSATAALLGRSIKVAYLLAD